MLLLLLKLCLRDWVRPENHFVYGLGIICHGDQSIRGQIDLKASVGPCCKRAVAGAAQQKHTAAAAAAAVAATTAASTQATLLLSMVMCCCCCCCYCSSLTLRPGDSVHLHPSSSCSTPFETNFACNRSRIYSVGICVVVVVRRLQVSSSICGMSTAGEIP